MSSTNEEISAAPPKPKTSPLEFRNTDLVSRLLAATPPYLYNMPLVPHSYFFSEMLRSLVQGKAEAAARMPPAAPHRRSRKRTWSHARTDHYAHKQMSPNTKPDSIEMPPPNWTPKIPGDKHEMFDTKTLLERPLELTMNKIPMNNNTKLCHTETQPNELRNSQLSPPKSTISSPNLMLQSPEKSDIHPTPPNGHVPMMFPPIPNLSPQENSSSSGELILPPPPPIWYPPLYPTPYGIDPLHFFIDLRVSGHIYDRKNAGKEHSNLNMNMPHPPNAPMNHLGLGNSLGHVLEMNNANANSTITSSSSVSENMNSFNMNRESLVKQSRHTSAFTVPTPSLTRNDPLNLSGNRYHSQPKIPRYTEEKSGKFDIKSMGFDTNNTEHGKSTNYIFKNLTKIYRDIQDTKHEQQQDEEEGLVDEEEEGIDLTSPRHDNEQRENEVNVKDEVADNGNKDGDKDEEKEKKCKDLRALIGLELVVDYVKHEVKPAKQSTSEGSITDIESNMSSPAVEVVTIHDVDSRM